MPFFCNPVVNRRKGRSGCVPQGPVRILSFPVNPFSCQFPPTAAVCQDTWRRRRSRYAAFSARFTRSVPFNPVLYPSFSEKNSLKSRLFIPFLCHTPFPIHRAHPQFPIFHHCGRLLVPPAASSLPILFCGWVWFRRFRSANPPFLLSMPMSRGSSFPSFPFPHSSRRFNALVALLLPTCGSCVRCTLLLI